MGVFGERSRWCFCSGGGRSERVKGSIFATKGSAFAAISAAGGCGGGGWGTGFLIHRNLLLTTHANLPSVAAAEAAEIRLCHGRLPARLVPHRFFITSSVLDLTIVGLDTVDADSTSQGQHPHYLKTCSNPSLDLGCMVYLLGRTDKKELIVGEGKVAIATDNLIKLSTDGVTWCPGSAGFDVQGNLAFMVCDPMKLASSPTARSSSASSSSSLSWKKDLHMQFGIPIPIICDWLHQHWEGSLDELSKPKLPLIRLMSSGQKSEHSCASFTMRQVFKSIEEENDVPSSSQIASKSTYETGSSSITNAKVSQGENPPVDLRAAHEQGILTPDIFESPGLTSGPVRKKEHAPVQLLDINFPPRASRSIVLPLPLLFSNEKNVEEPKHGNSSRENGNATWEVPQANSEADHKVLPVGSCQEDCCSEVQSSSSPLEVSEFRNEGDGSSSGEETMYSAETMESRNFPSPKENMFQHGGRSQSCMNYSRWNSTRRNSIACNGTLQKQRTVIPVRKACSQAAALPQRSHDYFSPTVSSNKKKRNSSEQLIRPRQSVVQVSPRWM
ncbi:uncharacterized protein LOC103710603 [Phoenix dactylifera]|uniref:Uncharacterized protein LOC103710603 n=1 Tax=Phoenix dactylifera TaxID=42345 RepID=A0A8B7C9W7_PHODC|nr:uncharacterized protein LOC103710603 [Phoenix dactylifera]